MSSSDHYVDAVRLLTRNVAMTLGEARAALVGETVAQLTEGLPVTSDGFVDKLVERTQQRLHDEFVYTT